MTGDKAVVRPSLWAMLESFGKWTVGLVGVLVALSLPVVFQASQAGGPWWLALYENFQFGASLLVPLIPAIRVAFTTYTLDPEGIRVRSAVLSTQDHRIPWEKITAVRERRTIIDRLVGTARMELVAYGARGATLQLVGVRDARAVRDLAAAGMRRHCSVTALGRSD